VKYNFAADGAVYDATLMTGCCWLASLIYE